MDETPKLKVSRDQIYKNETVIAEQIGDKYSNTMCHRMKEKDTFNTIFPTNGLWKGDIIFRTTNNIMVPTAYIDPYQDETHYFKMDANKRYNEEMARAKNMMVKKKKDVKKDSPSK